jgi:hypothetical protein
MISSFLPVFVGHSGMAEGRFLFFARVFWGVVLFG